MQQWPAGPRRCSCDIRRPIAHEIGPAAVNPISLDAGYLGLRHDHLDVTGTDSSRSAPGSGAIDPLHLLAGTGG